MNPKSWNQARDLMKRRRLETGAASIGLLVVTAGIAGVPLRPHRPTYPTAFVRTERFAETLIEAGTVTAEHLMFYGSTIPGTAAKIAMLAPEGRAVAAGDVLIQFDGTAYEQELARENAALLQAEADVARAQEELRIERLQAEGDLGRVRDEIAAAESGLADQTDGAGSLAVAEAEAAAAQAARDVERARAAYEDLQPLLAEGFITRIELEHAGQELQRAEEQKRLADRKRDTLARFGRPAAINRARAEVQSAREALARQREGAAARRTQREAALNQARGRAQEVRARIAMLEDRLARLGVRAEASGLVVYRDLFFGSDRRKPQVGDEVWPNQPIITLPDSSRLAVQTRIRETDLHKVSASQHVFVRVDAYPDLRLRAAVSLVGALAEADATRANAKFFPVTVTLVDQDPRLRPGMTARVEIQVAAIDGATVVPVESVFEHDGEHFCYVLRAGRPVRQTVTVLADNGVAAAVGGELKQGERILLVDPLERQ